MNAPLPGTVELPKAGEAPAKWPLSLLEVPYLDDELMDGSSPQCSAADFKKPRLRRSPFDFVSINWNKSMRLGGGLDGFVWKVWFGDDDGPYAFKVFWDTAPRRFYWGVQRECQTAALFQMMHTAVTKAAVEAAPIIVKANPRVTYNEEYITDAVEPVIVPTVDRYETSYNAKSNLNAFSDEARHNEARHAKYAAKPPGETITISSMPRMAQCYGWLKFSGESYNKTVPRRLKAPPVPIEKGFRNQEGFDDNQEYTAIVYEYIEEGPNDEAVVDEVARFLFLAGFMFSSSLDKNWRRSILLDHADVVHARGYNWSPVCYELETAGSLLQPSEHP